MKKSSLHRLPPLLISIGLLSPVIAHSATSRPPNVVVILSDDQGYADISFNPQHPSEVSTPHLDSLARESVFFSQGYITGNVCSPTRAGLLTGRYQQRAGVYNGGQGGKGMALSEKIFPRFFKPAGYVSVAYGKWHLGTELNQSPTARGFDEWYGFLGRGAHDYFDLAQKDPEIEPIYRNGAPIKDEGYLTTRLTEEAVSFIKKNKAQPFVIYLAYNAVHAPAQAPAEDIARMKKKYPDLSAERVILMAMLEHLDLGVGKVVGTLKEEGVWNDTLLFFLTDNGGSGAMKANNTPLRGFKQQNYEGGLRTPFMMSWPARFKGGRVIDAPVVSLDILPTAMDAAGLALPTDRPFDGQSLLPLVEGKTASVHPVLYWSEGGDGGWAVRSGDWKAVVQRGKINPELFNLAKDPAEKTDLASSNPDKVKELTALYDAWLAQMANPLDGSPKRLTSDAEGKKARKRQAADPEEEAPRKKKRNNSD
jgi:arylsulfatase A-like enzyme